MHACVCGHVYAFACVMASVGVGGWVSGSVQVSVCNHIVVGWV